MRTKFRATTPSSRLHLLGTSDAGDGGCSALARILFCMAALPPAAIAQALDYPADENTGAMARVVEAAPLRGVITIDGRLDEDAWRSAPALTNFVQRDPEEGAVPTEASQVHVLYDEDAIYIGARLFDSAPDSIVSRLGRRDAYLEADRFVVFLDPYLDRRSGYYFGINAAGTLSDGVLLNDDWDSDDWDGVWEGRASIDEEGWSVEMRIPYSQLRFYQQDAYVWGINFRRDISRKNERNYLVYKPRGESGFVSRFWELKGIHDIRPRRQIEITPYLTSRARFDQTAGDNPFNDGSLYGFDGGVDVRVGVTPNLTLNGTLNPDFGQVEVDPAVINLSDVETFFSEKRPFFIEGASSIQNFGYGGSSNNWGFNWGNPSFFYSRRIGRPPQGGWPDHDHAHAPDGTRILGAAKLSGKVAGNWNVGMMHALTSRESARFDLDGERFNAEVEPATYYGVYRVQKEFAEGRQGLGFLSTLTNRFFDDARLKDEINSQAIAVGIDGWTFLDTSKKWVVNGWSGISHVAGSEDRMASLQQSSMHYFQRPDARYVSVDSTATSMTGWAGRIGFNKQSGRIMFNSALGTISPSFNVNDVGFQWRTEVINAHVGGGYRWPDPGRFTRSAVLLTAFFGSLDYEGNRIWSGVWGLAEVELLNYFGLGGNFAFNPTNMNNRRTRGGPIMVTPPGFEANLFGSSDSRKSLVVRVNGGGYWSESFANTYLSTDFELKPATNVSVTLSPSLRRTLEDAQWVDVFDDPLASSTFGKRYVFARLEQFTASSSVRLNWTFTPKLSLQLYAQPLISAGKYEGFKELARPRSYAFNVFGEGNSTFDSESLVADPDGDGPAPAIELPNLDFNVASLRGTAVLRWEYLPGSTLYLVWTQRRSDAMDDPDFRVSSSFDQLWTAPMENIFLIKLTYWFTP